MTLFHVHPHLAIPSERLLFCRLGCSISHAAEDELRTPYTAPMEFDEWKPILCYSYFLCRWAMTPEQPLKHKGFSDGQT